MRQRTRVCIVPMLRRLGGPATFQRKLSAGLQARGIDVTYDMADVPYEAILVINGTRHLSQLHYNNRRRVRIVQRLGLPNSLHLCRGLGLLHYARTGCRNLLMRYIRGALADRVVYQSHFVRERWDRSYGPPKVSTRIIYNGVDLRHFCPGGDRYKSTADICLASVEGTQGMDRFDIAIELAQGLAAKGKTVELVVCGIPWRDAETRFRRFPFVSFRGVVPNAELPSIYRGAALAFSGDATAACPNSVIEALACGTPVLGYSSGALPELLDDSAGRCVPSAGDIENGENPGNVEAMVEAALQLSGNQAYYSSGARRAAEEKYDLNRMVDEYVDVLLG